jgi:hypothetical protein
MGACAAHEGLDVTVTWPAARARAVLAGLAIPTAGPLLLTAVGKALAPAGGAGGPPSWLGLVVALLFALGALVGVVGSARAQTRARLSVEPDALVLGDVRVPLDLLEGGLVVPPRPGEPRERVELSLRDGRVAHVDVPAGAGEPLLSRLGLGPDERRARIPLHTHGERALVAFGGATLGLVGLVCLFGLVTALLPKAALASLLAGPAFPPLAAVLGLLAAAAGARLTSALPSVVVGAEGIVWTTARIPAQTRSLAFSDVADVEVVEVGAGRLRQARVEVRDERGVVHEVAALHAQKRPELEAIARRIELGLASYRDAEGGEAAALLRGGAPLGTWLEGLRARARRMGYREGSLEDERLGQLVADPRARPEVRVGAAVMLTERGGEAGERRVRIAADAVADERLRVALESVAQGRVDEPALASALDAEREEALAEEAHDDGARAARRAHTTGET